MYVDDLNLPIRQIYWQRFMNRLEESKDWNNKWFYFRNGILHYSGCNYSGDVYLLAYLQHEDQFFSLSFTEQKEWVARYFFQRFQLYPVEDMICEFTPFNFLSCDEIRVLGGGSITNICLPAEALQILKQSFYIRPEETALGLDSWVQEVADARLDIPFTVAYSYNRTIIFSFAGSTASFDVGIYWYPYLDISLPQVQYRYPFCFSGPQRCSLNSLQRQNLEALWPWVFNHIHDSGDIIYDGHTYNFECTGYGTIIRYDGKLATLSERNYGPVVDKLNLLTG